MTLFLINRGFLVNRVGVCFFLVAYLLNFFERNTLTNKFPPQKKKYALRTSFLDFIAEFRGMVRNN